MYVNFVISLQPNNNNKRGAKIFVQESNTLTNVEALLG